MAETEAPADLLKDGKSLWKSITDEYELRLDEKATLASACRATDRVTLMRDELGQMSLMVTGSMGQQVINPLVAEIRTHEAQVASLLARLKLPDEGNAEAKGERSSNARNAANARWSKRGA